MTEEQDLGGQTIEWQAVLDLIDTELRTWVNAAVRDQAVTLAHRFYSELMKRHDLDRWLDHERVNQRLHASMVNWITTVFDESRSGDQLIELQRRTGEVHARMGVGHSLVARGARVLKRSIAEHLRASEIAAVHGTRAIQYVYELIDIALDVMGQSTSTNAARLTRTDEAYKLHFLSQNLRAERERQKLQLLEWAHQILVHNYWEITDEPPTARERPKKVSQFELWIQHKASILFESAPEISMIRARIGHIEGDILPRLRSSRHHHNHAKDVVAELQAVINDIQALTGSMFDRASGLEDGRDDVTQLLNKRYFPSIVKREIELVQAGGDPFALLLIEIDRFDDISHVLGPQVADLVLSQVAESLGDHTQAGDFLFRVGQAQFMILLVETSGSSGPVVSEALRAGLARLVLRTPAALAPNITVSIGMASFDGHPDYQQLIERAELALRRAKAEGMDRVVVAE